MPGVDEVVPERWPTVTQAGNMTFRKLRKRERSDYYTIFVCAQALVTVREAFAVAPGIQSARVTALRIDGRSVYGEPYVSCLMAAAFDRPVLAAVLWESASAVDVVNQAAKERLLKQSGPSKDLTPLDLSSEPELQALVHSIDLRDLGQESAGVHTGSAMSPARKPSPATRTAVAEPIPGPATDALKYIAQCRKKVDALIPTAGAPSDAALSEMQQVVQSGIDLAVNTMTEVSNRVIAYVKAGGAREQRGRAALPYVEKAMAAAKAITENAKGRNPYSLLSDAEDVLRPLEIAYRHVAA